MFLERGFESSHEAVRDWEWRFAPLIAEQLRRRRRGKAGRSWYTDETYLKVGGKWCYLYRTVDSNGIIVEFMLRPTRDAVSAKRFFRKALLARHTTPLRVINVDKNPSYPKAVSKLGKKGTSPPECEPRPVKYLNNRIEQDHRFIKWRVNPGMGFWAFDTAWRTLQRNEAMHQLRKGQIRGTSRQDIRSQVRFVHTAFVLAA